jgi:hypothetical protein
MSERLRRFTAKFHGPEVLRIANDSYHGEEPLPLSSWLMSHRNKLPGKFKDVYASITKWAKKENVQVTGTPSSNSPTPLPINSEETTVEEAGDYGTNALATMGEGMALITAMEQLMKEITSAVAREVGSKDITIVQIRSYIMSKKYWDKTAVDNIIGFIDSPEVWKTGYLQKYKAHNASLLCTEIIATLGPDQVVIMNSSMSKAVGVDKEVLVKALQSESAVTEQIEDLEASLKRLADNQPPVTNLEEFTKWSAKCAETADKITALKSKTHKVLEILQDM